MVQLDENTPVMENGRDVNVINAKIAVKCPGIFKAINIISWVLIIPGLILWINRINAKKYFEQLQQKLQHDASQIDNYLEQRVVILKNAAALVEKAVKLDKEVFVDVAKYRANHTDLNQSQESIDRIGKAVNVCLERYPELKAHKEIEDAMQQNSYLQKEITAAREVYNDTVAQWNREIFVPISKMAVADKEGYTTRIPFATSSEIKQQAREVFF